MVDVQHITCKNQQKTSSNCRNIRSQIASTMLWSSDSGIPSDYVSYFCHSRCVIKKYNIIPWWQLCLKIIFLQWKQFGISTFCVDAAVLNMLLFTGLFSFLWLLCFSYLTSKWRRSYKGRHRSTSEAPLAFAFFCLVIYVR